MKHCTHGLQLVSQGTECCAGGFVTGGNGNPRLKQGLDKRRIGNPNADDSDAFSLKRGKIVLQCNGHVRFLLID